jgi:hypothetical protein
MLSRLLDEARKATADIGAPPLAREDISSGFLFSVLRTMVGPSKKPTTLSIRYKCRMIRLTDEQWERIRTRLQRNLLRSAHTALRYFGRFFACTAPQYSPPSPVPSPVLAFPA